MTRNPPPLSDERSTRSRYVGTRPFSDSADDRARFKGRTEEGEQLYLRVLSVPLVVLFGKSGFGKTSLLQAWLFPRLRQKPFLPVMVRLNVKDDPLTFAVARSIRQAVKAEGLELTEGRTDGLWELLSTTTVWRDDLLLTPVLVFDPFEEVFTLRDPKFRADLAREVGALASGIAPERLHAGRSRVPEPFAARPHVKIVISLREDYLGALQEFSTAIPSLFHERLRLEPLTEEAAREAITEPAQLTVKAGEEPYWAPRFDFETTALDSMIAYLKGTSGVIEPFQLQLLCRHAEAIAHGKHAEAIAHEKGSTQNASVELTLADFNGGKDFASVLNNFYRDTLRKLPRSQRKRAEALCEEGLLDASGHRLMLEEGQLRRAFGLAAETLATLSQARLVRREPRLESIFYEISHDRLAESIFASRRFKLPAHVRRGLYIASIVLILGGLLVWNQTVRVAHDRAKEAQQKAEAARQNVEGLLSFLLGEEFLGDVRDMGHSTILGQVQEQVEYHGGAGDQWAALNRGLALRNRGDLERTQGSVAKAVALFRQALTVIESSPNSPESRREAARTHERLGEASADQGQVTQALSHYEAAEKTWRQIVTSASTVATDDCISLADSLVRAGDLKHRMGEAPLALKGLEEAVEIASTVLFGRRPGHEGCGPVVATVEPYPDATALIVLSRAVRLRAIILDSQEDYEGAVTLAMRARWLRPPSISARKNALAALTWRGNRQQDESPQAALKDYLTALAGFEELRRWDPSSRLWQRERAANQLLVSEGIVACHTSQTKDCDPLPSREEAEAASLEAMAALRALAQVDPSNVSRQQDLGWALQAHANVLAAQGRKDDRLAIIEQSERVYSSSQLDNADAAGVEALGRLLLEKSDALAAVDQPHIANETLQRSINLFERLIAAHPVTPSYVGNLLEARRREAENLRKAGDETGADAAESEVQRLKAKYETSIRNRAEEAEKLGARHIEHVNEGAKLFEESNYTAALGEFNAAESAMQEYIRLRPTDYRGYDWLRNIYDWIHNTQAMLGNAKGRAAALSTLMRAAQIAAWLTPEDSLTKTKMEMIDNYLEAMHGLSVFLYNNGRRDEALAMLQEEVVVAEASLQETTQNDRYLHRLGDAKGALGKVRRILKTAGWEEAIRSGLIHLQKAANLDTENPKYLKTIGLWRELLADELKADDRNTEAWEEYRLAFEAFQEAEGRAPEDMEVREAIRARLRGKLHAQP